jgi:hypothetical protein
VDDIVQSHIASSVVEAIAALERAAGIMQALGHDHDAHRCAVAADRLHAVFVAAMPVDKEAD